MNIYKIFSGSQPLIFDAVTSPFVSLSCEDLRKRVLNEFGINNEIPFDDKPVAEFEKYEDAVNYINNELNLKNIVSICGNTLCLVVYYANIFCTDEDGSDICDEFFCSPFNTFKRNEVLGTGNKIEIRCIIPDELEWLYPELYYNKKSLAFSCEISLAYGNMTYNSANDAAEACTTFIVNEYCKFFGNDDENVDSLWERVYNEIRHWFLDVNFRRKEAT